MTNRVQVGGTFSRATVDGGARDVHIRLGADGFWRVIVEARGAVRDESRWLMLDQAQRAASAWLRDHAA